MLFWIFVGAFIIALVLVYLLRDTDILLEISAIIATLLGGVIVISLCIMACNYIGIDAKVAGYQKRYGLVYIDRDEDENSGTLERIKKDSFYWYQKIISSHGKCLD